MRLTGKTALIIGGATGFGLACAERFAAEGATVAIAGRRKDLAEHVGGELGGSGHRCDITDDAEVKAVMDEVVAAHGGLDICVNFAGYEQSTPISDLTPEILEPMVQVQLTGAIYVIRHAAAAMTQAGGGSIISCSSLTAHAPAAGQTAYAASKKGLEYATEIAAVEYGPANIRVNCVSPSLIETPMTKNIFDIPLVIEAMRRQTPLGRMGSVDDIANAVLFLASDESSFITGQTLRVDGGGSMQKLPTAEDYMLLAAAQPELLEPPASQGD